MKRLILLVTLLLILAIPAFAGWTVVDLGRGIAKGVSEGQQTGVNLQASLWNGTASSIVDLNPAGALHSWAYGISGRQQVGYASYGGMSHAGLWTGTAASWVDLHPTGALSSIAFATSGNQQAGNITVSRESGMNKVRGGYWTGTAESWVNLTPEGFIWSYVSGVSNGQQVGSVNHQAALWAGTAASWVNLNPDGASFSEAFGVSNGQQVGYANLGGVHAGLWNGTAASWIDLNPAGALFSKAYGVSNGYQVGYANINGKNHAGLWHGSASSWVDLSNLLTPNTYLISYANGIEVLPTGEIFVVGSASIPDYGAYAMLWKYTPETIPNPIVPEPTTILGFLAFTPALITAVRRKRVK